MGQQRLAIVGTLIKGRLQSREMQVCVLEEILLLRPRPCCLSCFSRCRLIGCDHERLLLLLQGHFTNEHVPLSAFRVIDTLRLAFFLQIVRHFFAEALHDIELPFVFPFVDVWRPLSVLRLLVQNGTLPWAESCGSQEFVAIMPQRICVRFCCLLCLNGEQLIPCRDRWTELMELEDIKVNDTK